jgi:transposase
MKVLVHDGIGVWLAARRLNSGKFAWPKDVSGTLTLSRPSSMLWCWACPGNASAKLV